MSQLLRREVGPEETDPWVTKVRDPAKAATPETRRFTDGKAWAAYAIARIPDGWAWRADLNFNDGTGGGTPWRGPYTTRQEALDAALDNLARYERQHADSDACRAASRLFEQIAAERAQDDLFGGAP